MRRTQIDIKAVNVTALHSLPRILQSLLPDGHNRGGEWVARNPTRNDRKAGSFSINMRTGMWADFATGDRGGDVVSLYAYLKRLSQYEAAKELFDVLGGDHA